LLFIVPNGIIRSHTNSIKKFPKNILSVPSRVSDPTQEYSPAGSYNGLFPKPVHHKLSGLRKVSQTVQSYLTWKLDDKIFVDPKPREKITVYFNGFDSYYSKKFDMEIHSTTVLPFTVTIF